MIITAEIIEPENYIHIVFDDGTYVNLAEEELKSASLLAEKGCLSE